MSAVRSKADLDRSAWDVRLVPILQQYLPNSDIRMRLLSRVLPADWYCDLKNGTSGVRLDEPQFASVFCNQGRRDGEPQSHTPRLCRKEWIEYALSILDWYSGSGVFDRQQYGRVTVETRYEPQTSCFGGHGVHCVDSVFDEVQEHLLDLRTIQMHLGKISFKLCSDQYFVDLKIMLQQS